MVETTPCFNLLQRMFPSHPGGGWEEEPKNQEYKTINQKKGGGGDWTIIHRKSQLFPDDSVVPFDMMI